MNWFAAVYFIFVVISFFATGWVAVYSHRRRDVPGAEAFTWLCSLIALLVLFEGFSMISPTKALALFWFDLRFVSLAFAPVIWLVFVLQYTGKSKWIKAPLAALFLAIPVLTQVIIWTNGFHHLWVKKPADFYQAGFFWIAQTSARVPGSWTWVHLVYAYGLIVAGSIILMIASVRLYRGQRKGAIAIAAGILVMTIGSVYPMLIPVSWYQFNPLTLSFAVGSLLTAWGIFYFQFFHAAPAFDNVKRFPVMLSIIFAVLITAILLAGFFYFRHFEKNYRAGVERQLSSILNLKIHEISQWRRERMGDAEVLYQNAVFARILRRWVEDRTDFPAKKDISVWLQKIRLSYEYENILILDTSGKLLLSALPVSDELCRDLAGQSAAVFSAGKVRFLDFHRERPDAKIHLSTIVPISDELGRIGLVVMMIDPDRYLYPLIKRWPAASKTAETLLVRLDGNTVLFLNDLRFHEHAALNLKIPLSKSELPAARAVKGEWGIFEGIDYRGIPVIAAVDRVPGSPWFMIARVDLEEVDAPVQSYFWLMIFLVGSLVAGTSAVVWIFWQRQSRDAYRKEIEAAEAITSSEEKFRKAFMTSPDAVSITRWSDGLIISVNPGFFEITGYTPEEISGKKMSDLSIWEDQNARLKLREKMSARGFLANEEVLLHRKSGETIYGLVSATLLDIGGEVHLLSMTRDITGRKAAQEALLASEKKYRELHESMIDGFVRIDMEGRIVDSNESYRKMLGYSEEELARLTYVDLTPGVWHSMEEAIIHKEILPRGYSDIYRKEYRKKDGTVFPVELRTVLLHDEKGHPSGMWAIVRDITERKTAEEKIRESEDKFKHVFEYSVIGKSITYPDGRIDANRAFCALLGYSQNEMNQLRWQDITHPDDIALTEEALNRVINGKDQYLHIIKRYLHKNGSVIWADVGSSLRRDEEGRPLYFITSIVNITERKQAEEEILQLNEMLEARVRERTAELSAKNTELERLNRIFVNRELRMRELKTRIDALEKEKGVPL